ncbi:Rpn family recombination-promoting nuclease/putative transposase [Desulfonatronum thioautotrophicum]|uniref:Rpn family recombination-promoting nuclease/putative transposase n=1 Tax=Desulfonatronum thioautotrophicum TaxID=617001 RepID=UPI0005EB22DB|nr:Rpn family recombination-promoting nuclease/putative transposase [Desulfonatronum thioautotrophicum]
MIEKDQDFGQGRAKHDELFKKVIGDPVNARDLLRAHLPPEVLTQLNMDTLQRIPATFIDENLKKHYADLVYTVKTVSPKCPEIRFYLLFEHKTWPDDFVGVQLLRYVALVWTSILEDPQYKHPKLPPILPIVFYQSNDGWVPKTSFRDLIYSPSEVFDKFIPDFTFDFIAATKIDPKAVQDNVILAFYFAILQALDSPRLVHLLPLLAKGLLEVREPREAMEYMLIFCRYLVKASEYLKEEDYKQALAVLPQGGKEIMDTLADQWLRQGETVGEVRGEKRGRHEGKLEGIRTTLLNQAAAKFEYVPVGFSNKINAIEDVGTLNSLSLGLLKSDSLEAFESLVDKATQATTH